MVAAPFERGALSVTEEVVVAQGCTSGCTYCFSRLARGRLTSVPIAEVVRRVRDATARGIREIRLTGLDTAAWGEDLAAPDRLPELLRAVGQVPGDFRVRVGMMSPQSLAPHQDAYYDTLAQAPAYRFLHLPLQSGSDRILDAMRRGYHTDLFRRQVDGARRRLPDVHVATDIIVGFPGETDEDFRATEELLEATGPETVNVTRFSPARHPRRPTASAPAPGRQTSLPCARDPASADLEDAPRALDRKARPGPGPGARARRQLGRSSRELSARGPR